MGVLEIESRRHHTDDKVLRRRQTRLPILACPVTWRLTLFSCRAFRLERVPEIAQTGLPCAEIDEFKVFGKGRRDAIDLAQHQSSFCLQQTNPAMARLASGKDWITSDDSSRDVPMPAMRRSIPLQEGEPVKTTRKLARRTRRRSASHRRAGPTAPGSDAPRRRLQLRRLLPRLPRATRSSAAKRINPRCSQLSQ